MKYGMWTFLVGLLAFAIFTLIDIPFWLVMVTIIPFLIIGLIYGSFLYRFRESLKMETIPNSGYKKRTDALDRESIRIEALGFRKIDQFYLKTIPDSVTYVFKHEREPICFCIYHFGKKFACDYVTRYRNGFFLTTSDAIDSGMTPRPSKALLQIFPDQTYEKLLNEHRAAHAYINRNSINIFDIPETEFRFYFMKCLHEQSEYIRKYPFWPILLLIRTLIQYGRKFCRTVPDQYPSGFADLLLESARPAQH
jgi:hypothetical protein